MAVVAAETERDGQIRDLKNDGTSSRAPQATDEGLVSPLASQTLIFSPRESADPQTLSSPGEASEQGGRVGYTVPSLTVAQ